MYEPNAIGYAESADGINWRKEAANPVFKAHGDNAHEAHKVTAAQVRRKPAQLSMGSQAWPADLRPASVTGSGRAVPGWGLWLC